MGKTKHFEVPIVLQNLPPAETLNQMMDSLNFLNSVVDEAFDSISDQVKESRDLIEKLRSRASVAQAKVDLISKQPNRATTVYSAQKYPGRQNKIKDTPLVDMTEDEVKPERKKYRLSLAARGERPRAVDTLSLFQRLSEKTSRKYEETPVGVGRLPSYLTSVSDCLLFNTDVNPYKKYSIRNALEGTEAKERERVTKGIGQQPQSIQDRNLVLDVDDMDMNFVPTRNVAPTFAMPTHIPDLQDLAYDANWSNHVNMQTQGFTSLAPSANMFSQLPDINEVPDFNIVVDVPVPVPQGVPEPPVNAPVPQNVQADAAKAPVPDRPPEPAVEEKMPAVPTEPAPAPKAAAPIKKPKAAAPAGRAALLEAIRNPGKKLKKPSKKKAKKPPPIPKTMSLMDHLKAKLKRRNDLMSGKLDASGPKSSESKADGDGAPGAPDAPKRVKFTVPEKKPQPVDEMPMLKHVPLSMQKSMLIVDEGEEDGGNDSGWDE